MLKSEVKGEGLTGAVRERHSALRPEGSWEEQQAGSTPSSDLAGRQGRGGGRGIDSQLQLEKREEMGMSSRE